MAVSVLNERIHNTNWLEITERLDVSDVRRYSGGKYKRKLPGLENRLNTASNLEAKKSTILNNRKYLSIHLLTYTSIYITQRQWHRVIQTEKNKQTISIFISVLTMSISEIRLMLLTSMSISTVVGSPATSTTGALNDLLYGGRGVHKAAGRWHNKTIWKK